MQRFNLKLYLVIMRASDFKRHKRFAEAREEVDDECPGRPVFARTEGKVQ